MGQANTIEELRQLAITFRDARNWKQFHDPKNLSMGLSIEAAEVLELFLWKNEQEINELIVSDAGRERLGEELADVMVYLLYLSAASGIDLAEAVRRKIELNAKKYPVDKSYNSSRKYTDL